jgi:hypothetical protein
MKNTIIRYVSKDGSCDTTDMPSQEQADQIYILRMLLVNYNLLSIFYECVYHKKVQFCKEKSVY